MSDELRRTESLNEIARSVTQLLVETRMQDNPTLRDQFAMAALTGELSSQCEAFDNNYGHGNDRQTRLDFVAVASYQWADAMMRARQTKTNEKE